MSVVLRLSRQGAKKNAFYRVVVADKRAKRDGRFIEHIGIYDPNYNPPQVRFDGDRLKYWLSVGAVASMTVGELIKAEEKKAAAAPTKA